jgi:hypothetical protein
MEPENMTFIAPLNQQDTICTNQINEKCHEREKSKPNMGRIPTPTSGKTQALPA